VISADLDLGGSRRISRRISADLDGSRRISADLARLAAEREDHASESRRHLRPEGDRLAVLVGEVVHLLRDLLAALAHVQLLRLEHGRVVLDKGELARLRGGCGEGVGRVWGGCGEGEK